MKNKENSMNSWNWKNFPSTRRLVRSRSLRFHFGLQLLLPCCRSCCYSLVILLCTRTYPQPHRGFPPSSPFLCSTFIQERNEQQRRRHSRQVKVCLIFDFDFEFEFLRFVILRCKQCNDALLVKVRTPVLCNFVILNSD